MSKLAKLNKRLSRAVLVIDGVVLFRSGKATSMWAADQKITMSTTSRQPRAKVYVSVLAWLRWRLTHRIDVEAVYVTPLHRLGNAVHQLGNAALVASAIGVSDVLIPRNDTFTRPVVVGEGIRLGFQLPRRRHLGRGRAVLVGRFFWEEEFPGVCSSKKVPAALGGITRSIMSPDEVAEVAPDTLVIHVRGGDVFSNQPSRRYGQPPFAFYQLVIASHQWAGVTVVSEDTNNPVVDLIARYCDQRGIDLTQVSGSLLSDLSVLLGARHLVVASGTFGRTVVLLSEKVRHVYEFEKSAWLYPLDNEVTLHRVSDVVGEYRDSVMADNWDNTEQQRLLMVQYPSSSLRLDTISG